MVVKTKKAALKKSPAKKAVKKTIGKAKPVKTTRSLKKSPVPQTKRKVVPNQKVKKTLSEKPVKKKMSLKSTKLLKTNQRKKSAAAKKSGAKEITIKKTAIQKQKGKPIKKNPIRKIKANEKVKLENIVNNIGIPGIEPYVPKAKEGYMSQKMSEHFRKILLAWKMRLIEEADRTVHHMQDEAANFPDPTDRATQEEEFNLELRARDRERKLIKKIDDALFMLDEGFYGHCEACGEPIGLRRLEARPTATLCVECKTLDEIREKQQGS